MPSDNNCDESVLITIPAACIDRPPDEDGCLVYGPNSLPNVRAQAPLRQGPGDVIKNEPARKLCRVVSSSRLVGGQ